MRSVLTLLAGLVLVAGCATEGLQPLGTVVLVEGDVKVEHLLGGEDVLAMGDPIYVGDQIVSGPDGQLHIKAIQAPVTFRIGAASNVRFAQVVPGKTVTGYELVLDAGLVRTRNRQVSRRPIIKISTAAAQVKARASDFVVMVEPPRNGANMAAVSAPAPTNDLSGLVAAAPPENLGKTTVTNFHGYVYVKPMGKPDDAEHPWIGPPRGAAVEVDQDGFGEPAIRHLDAESLKLLNDITRPVMLPPAFMAELRERMAEKIATRATPQPSSQQESSPLLAPDAAAAPESASSESEAKADETELQPIDLLPIQPLLQ